MLHWPHVYGHDIQPGKKGEEDVLDEVAQYRARQRLSFITYEKKPLETESEDITYDMYFYLSNNAMYH